MDKTVRYFKRTLKKRHDLNVRSFFINNISYNRKYKKNRYVINLYVETDNLFITYTITRLFGIDQLGIRTDIKNHDFVVNYSDILEYIGDLDVDKCLLYYKGTNYVMVDFYNNHDNILNNFIEEEDYSDIEMLICKSYEYGKKKKRNPKLINESNTKSANKI